MTTTKPAAEESGNRPLRFTDTQASVLLDLARGLAAILVLLEHWHHIFFVDFSQITSHRHLLAIPYLLVSAGHQAVVIFFVLSGYLISGSIFRMFRNHQWSWRTYGLHRIIRLWIVLVPALLLTAVCDRIGMHLHRASAVALYAGHAGGHIIQNDVFPRSGLAVMLGNLFFLQDVIEPVFGSNGALWSLANEFWYYVLFPLAFIALRVGRRWPSRLAHGASVLLLAYFLRNGILQAFPVWLLGTLLVIAPQRTINVSWRWISTAIYVPVFYLFSKWTKLPLTYSDWLLGIVTLLFLWVLISTGSKRVIEGPITHGIRALARFSYTLYLVHLPVLVLLAALFVGSTRWPPDTVHTLAGLGVLLFVIAFAYMLATVTEFKTDRLRSALERRWGISGQPSMATKPAA